MGLGIRRPRWQVRAGVSAELRVVVLGAIPARGAAILGSAPGHVDSFAGFRGPTAEAFGDGGRDSGTADYERERVLVVGEIPAGGNSRGYQHRRRVGRLPLALAHRPSPRTFSAFNAGAVIRLCNSFDAKVRRYRSYYATLPHVQDAPFVIALRAFDRPLANLAASRPIMAALYGL